MVTMRLPAARRGSATRRRSVRERSRVSGASSLSSSARLTAAVSSVPTTHHARCGIGEGYGLRVIGACAARECQCGNDRIARTAHIEYLSGECRHDKMIAAPSEETNTERAESEDDIGVKSIGERSARL